MKYLPQILLSGLLYYHSSIKKITKVSYCQNPIIWEADVVLV